MSKDKVQVAAQIYPVNGVINVDYRYGPYESIAEAVEFLGPDNLDCIKAGLKFGIKETDGTVTDYVFLEDNGGADKVRKVLHIDEATTENAGLMSAHDKAALAAVQAKAQENADDIDALEQDMAEANTGIQQNASAIQTNASDIASANTTIAQILAANAELRTTVNGLVGISNDNFMGIFQTANDLPPMTAPGWALVGTSLSSLLLYTYTDVNGVWTKYSDDTYDFTDYSGLVTQVVQIGSKLGDLANLRTTDKTSAVNAINEIDSKITPSISSTEIAIDIDGTKAASIEHFDSSLFDNVPTYDEVHDIVEEEVVDSLDSDATNKPLSAAKGKELNGRITPEISYVGGISTDINGTKSVSPEYFDSSLIENVPTYDELVDINTNIYLYPRTIHIPQWPNIFYTYHPLYEEVTLTSNNKLINII